MSREAMQMALEALMQKGEHHPKVYQAAEALRQALETEQEPVAFINVEKQKLEWAKLTSWHTPTIVNLPKIPLYTAPPKKEWVGLTDQEIHEIDGYEEDRKMYRFARAIEAKLREKNT